MSRPTTCLASIALKPTKFRHSTPKMSEFRIICQPQPTREIFTIYSLLISKCHCRDAQLTLVLQGNIKWVQRVQCLRELSRWYKGEHLLRKILVVYSVILKYKICSSYIIYSSNILFLERAFLTSFSFVPISFILVKY